MYSWLTVLGAGGTALTALGLLLHRFQDRRVLINRDALHVLATAMRDAERRGHRPVTVGHLALALLVDPSLTRDLEVRAVSLQDLCHDLEQLLPPRVGSPAIATDRHHTPPDLQAILRASARLSISAPGPHHVLRALFRSEHHTIRAVFERHGLTAERWPPPSPSAELPPTNAAETGPYRGAPTSRANTDVIFWNDKKTTMDFVIGLLRDAFAISDPLASRLMLTIDREGFAVVGTYERHEADRLAEAAVRLAREQSFPLVVTVEEHGHIQSMSRVTRWLLRRRSARLATQFVLPEPRDS